jgi:hypothetical protein
MEGIERESKLLKVNNEGEERVATSPRKKKGPFIVLSTKYGHCRIFLGQKIQPRGQNIRPPYRGSCTKVLRKISKGPKAKICPKIRPLGSHAQKSLAEFRGPDYSNNLVPHPARIIRPGRKY